MGTHFHDTNIDELYEMPGADCALCIPDGNEPFKLKADVKIAELKAELKEVDDVLDGHRRIGRSRVEEVRGLVRQIEHLDNGLKRGDIDNIIKKLEAKAEWCDEMGKAYRNRGELEPASIMNGKASGLQEASDHLQELNLRGSDE